MDKFHRGMRRVAIVIWILGCAFSVIIAIENGFSAGRLGYGVGTAAGWSLGWWLFVFIVRWIWLGFFGKTP